MSARHYIQQRILSFIIHIDIKVEELYPQVPSLGSAPAEAGDPRRLAAPRVLRPRGLRARVPVPAARRPAPPRASGHLRRRTGGSLL